MDALGIVEEFNKYIHTHSNTDCFVCLHKAVTSSALNRSLKKFVYTVWYVSDERYKVIEACSTGRESDNVFMTATIEKNLMQAVYSLIASSDFKSMLDGTLKRHLV